MEQHREELLKKYLGEENFKFLIEEVCRFWNYLEGEINQIHKQKTDCCITSRQSEVLVKSLFKELEFFYNKTFPKLISNLKVDVSFLDTEEICHEFCAYLFVYFNKTYLDKFRNK